MHIKVKVAKPRKVMKKLTIWTCTASDNYYNRGFGHRKVGATGEKAVTLSKRAEVNANKSYAQMV